MIETFCNEYNIKDTWFNNLDNEFLLNFGVNLSESKELFNFFYDLVKNCWKNIDIDKTEKQFSQLMNNNKDQYFYSIAMVIWFEQYMIYCHNNGLWNAIKQTKKFKKNNNNDTIKIIKIRFCRSV